MSDVATELENALKEATATENDTSVEDSSPEDANVETESEGKKPGKGAQARIRELVEKTKGIETELEKYKNIAGEKDQELKKLVDLLQARENDSRVVKKIQELYATDEKWKDTIEKLDKVVRGEAVEEESTGDKNKDVALEDAKKLIKSTREELDDAIADQKADLLLHKANLLIDKYMAELPEEYGEVDRKRLNDVLKHYIDWNGIEEKPSALANKVAEGIQEAINWYGVPQGSAQNKEGEAPNKTVAMPETPKQKLDRIMALDVGKLKTIKTPSGERVVPVVAEEDFTKLLAESLRLSNAK